MIAPANAERYAARLKIVEEHVEFENRHNLDGILSTFGTTARYDDEPWDLHYSGHREVRAFYDGLLSALPDLSIDVTHRHLSDTAVVLEVIIRGQHTGSWRGLPPTGSHVELPLCGIFTFDDNDRLAGEKIYYDRATLLRQLGVFHEPNSFVGQALAMITHPLTMARILRRKISSVSGAS